ncbi:NAD(P)-dependent oxidoreductase [Streptomyces sp. BR123]|uniref:NAD(P)-dependent oxidoreductase n=1 Tax=Streptomyces sp. BR123 TaxID=2749828 RepID=UPI0015C47304|nr:NAD(P)-binding domain-containing protein [Streptomyces sp. BR123]NXY93596.1 NAD(P)-dependent oxidoreductase [Streptomyces sp. BR123]
MPDVSVLGSGSMGSALARVLAAAGLDVAVWNRTADRARALDGNGLLPVERLADAVRCAPVVLVCLTDYAASRQVLAPVIGETRDRIVVQMSTGTPADAREMEAWLRPRGCRCLDAAIMAYPRHLGTGHARVLYSGPGEDFAAIGHVARALGGTAAFLGDDIALANAHDGALLTFLYAATCGFLEGAAIASAAGIPLEGYADDVVQLFPALEHTVRGSVPLIAAGRYDDDEAPLVVHSVALRQLAAAGREAGVPGPVAAVLEERVRRRMAVGAPREHIAAVFEELRGP